MNVRPARPGGEPAAARRAKSACQGLPHRDRAIHAIARAPFEAQALLHPRDIQIEDDAGHHVEISALDGADAVQGEGDDGMSLGDQTALVIDLVRKDPGMDAHEPLPLAEEGDLQQIAIVEARHAAEPGEQFLPTGQLMQD